MMIKKILIAGATGFIGSHLVEELLQNKYKISVLKRSFDNTERIDKYASKIDFFDIDLGEMEKAFEKVDLVINLVTDFGRAKDSKTSEIVETNVVFALRMLELAEKNKVKYYFTMDSALSEDVNLYAYTKKVLKSILGKYFVGAVKVFNIRLEYIYGENDDLSKFLPMVIDKLEKNEELDMSSGNQDLDFLYVKDCVGGIGYIIKNVEKYHEDFNELQIGTGKTILLKDLVMLFKHEIGSNSKINFGAVPYRENEQMHSVADISSLGGWKPSYDYKDAIRNIIKNDKLTK